MQMEMEIAQQREDAYSLEEPSSSEYISSDEDDKTQPGFMRKDKKYHSLPANVRHAIDVGK
jgi:hypothetical protein